MGLHLQLSNPNGVNVVSCLNILYWTGKNQFG